MFHVRWGNGSITSPSNLLSFGPLSALHVNSAPESLLAVPDIVDLGYTIIFTNQHVYICPNEALSFDSSVCYTTNRNHEDGLWHIDLCGFIEWLSSSLQQGDSMTDNKKHTLVSAVNSAQLKFSQSTRDKVYNLHERLGHPSLSSMIEALDGPNPAWVGASVSTNQIRTIFNNEPCLICALTKRNLPSPIRSLTRPLRHWAPGEAITTDIVPNITPQSFDKAISFFPFTCLSTGKMFCIPTRSKATSAFIEAFQQVLNYFKSHGFVTRMLRSDSESIFKSEELQLFLANNHIYSESSAPDKHYQNTAERHIQTIIKGTSSIIHSQMWLSARFWDEAMTNFVQVRNATPNVHCPNSCPDQVITGQPIDLATQFPCSFGDLVVVGIPKIHRTWKFDTRNDLAIYLNQSAEGSVSTFRVYQPIKKKIITSGYIHPIRIPDQQLMKWFSSRINQYERKTPNVIVQDALITFEDIEPFIDISTSVNDHQVTSTIPLSPTIAASNHEDHVNDSYIVPTSATAFMHHTTVNDQSDNNINHLDCLSASDITTTAPNPEEITYTHTIVPLHDDHNQLNSTSMAEDSSDSDNNHHLYFKPQIQHFKINDPQYPTSQLFDLSKPLSQPQYNLPNTSLPQFDQQSLYQSSSIVSAAAASAITINHHNSDNPTLQQALNSIDRISWLGAINKEMKSIMSDTLQPISAQQIPEGAWIVPTTMQLKLKRNAQDGTIDKFKARLCLRGDLLHYFYNKNEIYTPTISPITAFLILQISIILGWKRKISDQEAAFLKQPYPFDERPIVTYLEPTLARELNLDPQQLYKLCMFMYGSGGAPRAHFEANAKLLCDNGYFQSSIDPCLFYRLNHLHQPTCFVTVHVDDSHIYSNDDNEFEHFFMVQRMKYNLTINHNADSYLGIHIEQISPTQVRLTQPKHLNALFAEFTPNIYSDNTIISPMPPKSSTTQPNDNSKIDNTSQPVDRTVYLHLLGMLHYITRSRPDISTAISFAATKSSHPTQLDYRNLLHIVDYLFQTKHLGLTLSSSADNPSQLKCYADASYLIHPDSKSHTGYCLSFGDTGSFYSKSSKQKLVATSSTHAEARALYSLITDIAFVINICTEIHFSLHQPTMIFIDNYPVQQLANGVATGLKRCKHFMMLLAYIKEQVQQLCLNVQHVDTTVNRADILSKPVSGSDFRRKRDMLLGYL